MKSDLPHDADLGPAETLARAFHETYERLAPVYGYDTREETAVGWDELPESNKRLMVGTCAELLARFPEPGSINQSGARTLHVMVSSHGDWILEKDDGGTPTRVRVMH